MQLFKTSGETHESVVRNQRHAFVNRPSDWYVGEIVLLSKNRADCRQGERQIGYVARIANVRRLNQGEADRLWPGHEGRWRYLVELDATTRLPKPFDLRQVLAEKAVRYAPVMTSARLDAEDETQILQHLSRLGIAWVSPANRPVQPTGSAGG